MAYATVLRRVARFSAVDCAQCFYSTPAASTIDYAATKKCCALFPSPHAVAPHFEVSRMVATNFAERAYRHLEKEYNRDSFVRSAMQASVICGHYIATQNWDGLSRICCEDLVTLIKDRSRFDDDDVLCAMFHSLAISGKKIWRWTPGSASAYFTAIVYLRASPDVPYDLSPAQYARQYKDIIVCNITLARTINPLGVWKASALNYFPIY